MKFTNYTCVIIQEFNWSFPNTLTHNPLIINDMILKLLIFGITGQIGWQDAISIIYENTNVDDNWSFWELIILGVSKPIRWQVVRTVFDKNTNVARLLLSNPSTTFLYDSNLQCEFILSIRSKLVVLLAVWIHRLHIWLKQQCHC